MLTYYAAQLGISLSVVDSPIEELLKVDWVSVDYGKVDWVKVNIFYTVGGEWRIMLD